jgi:hypothetical protein
MEITITIFEIPITRDNDKEIVLIGSGQKLTEYKIPINDEKPISVELTRLSKESDSDFQTELALAKHDLSKTTVKKKIITNIN